MYEMKYLIQGLIVYDSTENTEKSWLWSSNCKQWSSGTFYM